MADPTAFGDFIKGRPLKAGASADEPTAAQRFAEGIKQRSAQAATRASIAIEQAPDFEQAAGGVRLSEAAAAQGVPIAPDLLTDAKDALAKRIESQTRRAQLSQSSRLSGWVEANPINAALARNELQNLSTIEMLGNRFMRGGERLTVGLAARYRTKSAEDSLQELQDLRADRKRGFGEIRAAVRARDEEEDSLFSSGDIVQSLASYPRAASRYIGSRMSFVSDEKLGAFEAHLKEALDERLAYEDEVGNWVASRTGSTARAAKAARRIDEIRQLPTMSEQLSEMAGYAADSPRDFAEWVIGVSAESLPNMAAAAAATVATRNPKVGMAALGATSAAVSEVSTFETLARDAGYDLRDPAQRLAFINAPETRLKLRDRAFTYGAVVGLIDAASGGLAGTHLAKSAGGNLVLQSLTQAAMGAGGETLGLLASGQELNAVDIVVEGLAEFASAPVEVATFGGQMLRHRRQANLASEMFDAIARGSDGSDMRRTTPNKYREAVAAVTKDGAVETMYVDAQQLEELFQSDGDGVTAEQFVRALPNVDFAAYEAALEAGTAFEIPTATYATDIAGTDFDVMLREHLKIDPEHMSIAEAREFEKQAAELAKTAQSTVDEIESGQRELERVAEDARNELVSSLTRAGRVSDVAEREATQAVAFARTMAKRLGVPLEDFLARYPLAQVQGVFDSVTGVREVRVTQQHVERVRAEDTDGDPVIAAMREAADAANLDVTTATPADFQAAVTDFYGPAAEPVLLNQGNFARGAPSSASGVTLGLLRQQGWGVVTAARGTEADAAQNAALEAELTARGIDFVKMEGVYKGESDGVSYLIMADRDTVAALGAKYDQESVLTSDGLVYMNGAPDTALNLQDLVTGDEARSRDFYSVMPDGTAWSVGFAGETAGTATKGGSTGGLREEVTGGELRGDGRQFTQFFADVTAGVRQQAQRLSKYVPVIKLPKRVKDFAAKRAPFSGNFEDHIQTSIPGYREMQDAVGYAVSEMLAPGEAVLDIGASEGAMVKTVVQENEGATAVALDPNVNMQKTFEEKPQVDGVEFSLTAFGSEEDAGKVAWEEDDGTEIEFFDPKGKKFDIVHEAMVFQFVSNSRGPQVERVKELMKPDGLFLTFEKFGGPAEQYRANEAKKDLYKAQYYDQDTLAAKAKEVLQNGGDEVEGMTALQVSVFEMETILREHFHYVHQIWDSGNFKGFAASDSYATVQLFLKNLPSLESEYSNVETPRRVYKPTPPKTSTSVPVNADGTVTLTHFSDEVRDIIKPSKAGTGPLRGTERNRRGPKKSFFGIAVGEPNGYVKERLGPYAHKVRVPESDLYNLSDDPDGLIGAIPDDLPAPQRVGWVEEQIQAAGFSGFYVTSGPQGMSAALFVDTKPESVTDDRTTEIFQTAAPTDSAAFSEWFGDSKVVDKRGDPLVVYHGTGRDFGAFDNSKTGYHDKGLWGRGHYFTSHPSVASSYAARGDAPQVIQAYLSIKNPLILRIGPDRVARLPDGTDTRELTGPLLDGSKIKDMAVGAGHDGVVQLKPDGTIGDVVAFEPSQVKSVHNRGTFSVSDPRILFQSGATPDFFSALTRSVENAKQKKAGAKEWFAVIQKLPGIKKAEIEWSGVEAWLFSQEGQITREDVAAFLRDNEVTVETVTLEGEADPDARLEDYRVDVDAGEALEADSDYLRELGWDVYGDDLVEAALVEEFGDAEGKSEYDLSDALLEELRDEAENEARSDYFKDPTYEYSVQVSFPDGVVQREVIVGRDGLGYEYDGYTFNSLDDAVEHVRESYLGEATERQSDEEGVTKWGEYTERGGENYREVLLTVPNLENAGPNAVFDVGSFTNADHYDEENVVVHARLNERLAEDGSKVLFVEEVQSDLGSFWRAEGGAPDARALRAAKGGTTAQTPRLAEPITPFEGEAYYALMMKKLLKMAAEMGADKLAWTPAYMQARRWSGAVQNVVSEISWGPTPTELGGEGAEVSRVALNGVNGTDTFVLDAEGVVLRKADTGSGRIPASEVVGKNISELIGGVMAKRVVSEATGRIAGENIVVGGDGYKTSYDQQIKKFVAKFAKKFGSRVMVDKTMPDFAANTGSDPLAEAVKQYGYENTLRGLRASGLRDADFWAQFDEKLGADIASAVARQKAETAKIEARIAAWDEEIAGGNTTAVGARETLWKLVQARHDQVARESDPEAIALTAYRRLTEDGLLARWEVKRALPQDVRDAAGQSEAVWSVDITPRMREAALQAQPLFQKRPEGARGSILLPTEPSRAPLISLFERADLSTFLHESGHYYLHVLQDIEANDMQTEGLAKDWGVINAWWASNIAGIAEDGGVTEAQVKRYLKRGTTGDLEIDQKVNVGLQEQWARAYEAYLLEGKAPSNALRAAFEAFSAWLLSVYRSAKGNLNVKISDELRGVFDRLLATDEEIAAVAEANNADDLVAQSAEALGIDPDEYARLVRLGGEAQDEAKQNLLAEIMAPIRREQKAKYRAEEAAIRDEMTRKVNQKPANRVREWLGNGRWLGGDAPVELPEGLRLSKQQLLDDYGPELVAALPRGKTPLWTTDGGLSADEVAGWFGYKSGDEMLQDVTTSPSAAAEIKSRTASEMRKRHGDPLSDGTVEAAAVDALHGDKRSELIAAELRALSKNAPQGVNTTKRQAREIARRTIRRMTVRQAVRSGQYLAAERRAAERSQQLVAKGDLAGAFEAKREQLLNNALYMESRAAADILARTEKRVAALKKKSVRKNLAGEYLEAIDDILASFDFRKSVTGRAAKRRAGLAAYVEMMEAAGRGNELAIPAHVLDEAQRKPYKSLTAAELEGVLDSLRNIEHTARMKKKLRDAQNERDLEKVIDSVVAEVDANVPDAPRNRVKTKGEKVKDGFREFANLLLNADSILRKLGGFERGAAYDALKAPIDAAADWASVEREKAGEAFEVLYSVYSAREQRHMGVRKHYEQLGGSFSRWDLISIALNMGNADNINRLMDKDSGRGFTAAQMEFVKDQLSKRDWDFVQSAWDLIGGYWPLIAARERRLTGVAPKRVEATPITTKHGTYAGGYYPIKYDGDLSGVVAAEDLADIQKSMMAGKFGKAQTRNGHTKERAGGSGGRVVQLGIEVMHMHIGQVIHDLAFSEAVSNTWRLLQDDRIRGAFERKGLLKDHQSLELWIQDTAVGQIAAGGVFARLALKGKNGFTLSKLAFNASTVIVQMTGLSHSLALLGPRYMALGASDYYSNTDRSLADIKEMSPFMRERETTFNRDINDILGDITSGPAASRVHRFQQAMGRVGFFVMQKVQYYGVDVPTWYAAYRQGLDKFGGDETKARQNADRMVARAQASGTFSDRSAFERGTLSTDTRQNGFVRLFTALGSYMFAKGNIAYEIAGRTKRDVDGFNARSIGAAVNGAVSMAMIFSVEAIAYNLIKGSLPSGDDDDESWVGFLARETTLSMMSTIPGVRDLGSALSGFEAGAYGSILETFSKPMLEAAQGEADIGLFKAISSAIGTLTGMPTGQLNKTVNAWYKLEQGEDISPIEFLMGVNR